RPVVVDDAARPRRSFEPVAGPGDRRRRGCGSRRTRLASALVPARRTKASPALDAPKVTEPLDDVDAGPLDDAASWRRARVDGDASGLDVTGVDIDASRLENVLLTGTRLANVRLTDCVLEGCDLSGAFFDDATLHRVELRLCRLLGWQAPTTRWQDVRL